MLKLKEIKDIIVNNVFFPKTKFQHGVLWNALSFVVMGVSGIVLNVLIVAKYGTEILGAFNQVYAVYIFASQLAVFGLYASVLKHISEHSENREICNKIFTSALFLGIIIGGIICFAYYRAIPFFGRLLNSSLVAKGLVFSVLGLWFFSLNKILLAFLNGKRLMKAFAVFTAIRYLMMILSLVILILLDFPGYFTPIIFTLAEFILLISLFIFSFRFFSFVSLARFKDWVKTHLIFGAKTLVGGVAAEVDSRIDVFILGVFLSDKIVGVYSLAAMFAEGFEHIPYIFRVNYNPLLVKFVVSKKIKELQRVIREFIKKWMPIVLMLGLFALLCFPIIVRIISSEPVLLKEGWIVFTILVIGAVIRSGYLVFLELPAQSGHPGWQTTLVVLMGASNFLLNYIFVQIWGVYGAAIATSLSFVLSMFYLKLIAKRLLGITI